MHAIDMLKLNAAAQLATQAKAKPVPKVLGCYAWFLDAMLARATITKSPKMMVRAARLGAFRRRAKPYTLGQIRAHVKYRRTHDEGVYATFTKAAKAV